MAQLMEGKSGQAMDAIPKAARSVPRGPASSSAHSKKGPYPRHWGYPGSDILRGWRWGAVRETT